MDFKFSKEIVSESHAEVIRDCKCRSILDMASIDSAENQKISVNLARGDIINLKSYVYKIAARYTQEERTTLND